MRRMLRTGWVWVIDAVMEFADVPGHGDVNEAMTIIPINREAKVIGAGVINRNIIIFLEGCKKVVLVMLVEGFDTKIVYSQAKFCFTCLVTPKASCERARDIAMWF